MKLVTIGTKQAIASRAPPNASELSREFTRAPSTRLSDPQHRGHSISRFAPLAQQEEASRVRSLSLHSRVRQTVGDKI